MKPIVIRNVEADQSTLELAIGPRLGRRFVSRPGVPRFGAVLIFPRDRVVLSGSLIRALRKLRPTDHPLLVFGPDFSLEARAAAADASCHIISEHEFGWTDESCQEIRKPSRTWRRSGENQ